MLSIILCVLQYRELILFEGLNRGLPYALRPKVPHLKLLREIGTFIDAAVPQGPLGVVSTSLTVLLQLLYRGGVSRCCMCSEGKGCRTSVYEG